MAVNSTMGVVCVYTPNEEPCRKHRRKFGSRPLLELIVRRLTDCQQLDGVVVVAGRESGDEAGGSEAVADLVPAEVPILWAEQTDLVGQLNSVLDATGATGLVKIDADHPFVDPVLVDRLVTTAQSQRECDYVGFCFRDGRPVIRSRLGTFAEWYSADALRRAEQAATTVEDRHQVTRFLCSHPDRFRLRFIPVPAALESGKVWLSVDNHEAWEHAQTMYDWLGHEGLDWDRIAEVMSA
ncbi:MAG TPA: NTP transferase domain-containing protein [Pirellulales bacterium]|nr:NTP transferase domain-containing protein [Pirellulales bacterium]